MERKYRIVRIGPNDWTVSSRAVRVLFAESAEAAILLFASGITKERGWVCGDTLNREGGARFKAVAAL